MRNWFLYHHDAAVKYGTTLTTCIKKPEGVFSLRPVRSGDLTPWSTALLCASDQALLRIWTRRIRNPVLHKEPHRIGDFYEITAPGRQLLNRLKPNLAISVTIIAEHLAGKNVLLPTPVAHPLCLVCLRVVGALERCLEVLMRMPPRALVKRDNASIHSAKLPQLHVGIRQHKRPVVGNGEPRLRRNRLLKRLGHPSVPALHPE